MARHHLSHLLVLGIVVGWLPPSIAVAQESVFRVVVTPTPVKERVKEKEIFSFSRFEPEFSLICAEMEEDGRRERFARIAEEASHKAKDCVSCRALWRTILAACQRRAISHPTPTTEVSAPVDGEVEEEQKSKDLERSDSRKEVESDEASSAKVANAAQHPPKRTAGERYPSTLLLDAVSQLSSEAFDLDPGEGGVSETFRYLAGVVRETKDLTDFEREYFDTVLLYLLAAWEGRVDESKLPPPTPGEEIDDFFR